MTMSKKNAFVPNNEELAAGVAACTTCGEAKKRDFSALPEISYFKVQSRNRVGSIKNRHDRACGMWVILVALKGGTGLRLASDVGYEYGMVFKCEFKTREEAVAAGLEYRSLWGKEVPKAEPKAKKVSVSKQLEEANEKIKRLEALLAAKVDADTADTK